MNLLENFRIAVRSLLANRLRSGLTMLGVIIGVMAVIAMLSIGRGAQASVTEQIKAMGTNLLIVLPGRSSQGGVRAGLGSAITLTYKDAEALEGLSSLDAVVPVIQTSAQVAFGNANAQTYLVGTTPEYTTVRNHPVARGSFISESHLRSRALVAVLGADLVDALFSGVDPLGQIIRIRGVPFRVIGVLERKGGGGFMSQDDLVIVPITTAFTRFPRRANYKGEPSISAIYIQAKDETVLDQASEEIRQVLRGRHHLLPADEDDFTIISQQDILNVAGNITAIFTIFLGGIAAISLIVGGIGIMNIMLVSVTERTREIGIRMAVGAKRRDILLQFLTEAIVLSLVGGAIGILLGWLASWGIGQIRLGESQIRTVVSPDSVLLATLFSAAVGLFFGLYPANRAATLNPIDALRYE